MTIDHIGAVFFPQVMLLRIIGRIAFPVFAFLLVEGFYHTHDVKKYALRMAGAALISELPFDLLFYGNVVELRHQNVFFTLCFGICMLYFMEKQYSVVLRGGVVILFFLLADMLRTDYGGWGLAMILCFFVFREKKWQQFLGVAVINIVCLGYLQIFACLAFLPLSFYNGEEGRKLGRLFYFFYPVHLIVLFIIRLML